MTSPLTGPILVVDDDPMVRETIRQALEDDGLSVVTAGDGRQALALTTERAPALVVLDVNLPWLDGYTVAATLRERHGDALPILIITAHGHPADKAQRVRAFAYLRKPFELDDLLTTIRRGLSRFP